jgi:threonine/homoserine/homoserine lactone efflux protein
LDLLAISLYAIFGVYLRNWFSKPKMTKLFNRCCAFFIGSIGLSLLIGEKNTGKEKFKVMAKSELA